MGEHGRMESNSPFTLALQLEGTRWRVISNAFGGDGTTLELRLDFERGARFACPRSGGSCGVHAAAERRWRHINFFQYRREIVARLSRIDCPGHGVLQAAVPWAREGSGFTLLFEAVVMLLAAQMPAEAVARMVGEEDARLWRLVMHHIETAHARADWSAVRKPAVHETSARCGHRYVTVFSEIDTGRVLFMADPYRRPPLRSGLPTGLAPPAGRPWPTHTSDVQSRLGCRIVRPPPTALFNRALQRLQVGGNLG